MVNRVRQFIRALTAKINDSDVEFINRYLNESEKALFNQLSTYEKKHSLCVARDILIQVANENLEYQEHMVRIGLLHDIGKIKYRLNTIDRVILVLLDKFTKGKIRNIDNKKVHIYFFHGEEGYNILKSMGYMESWLNIIRDHHSAKHIEGVEMRLLVEADNRN